MYTYFFCANFNFMFFCIYHNITVFDNTANLEGGGLSIRYGNPQIKNSIIWGNNSPNGESIYMSSSNPIITHSDIEPGWAWDYGDPHWEEDSSNIYLDPLFVDPDNGDFSLQELSPCIDTGQYDEWNLDSDGSRADMGVAGGSSILPNFTMLNRNSSSEKKQYFPSLIST